MDPFTLFALVIVGLFVVLMAGMPVGYAMGVVSLAGLMLIGGPDPMLSTAIIPYKALNDFVLLAVPLFVLSGSVIMASGLGNGLFDVAAKWLSWMPNGLPVATVGACAIFAAITGSSVASVATIGVVAAPLMISRGYRKEVATGVICCAGTLAILIPPSVIMVVYGSMTGTSVGALFMGGFIPGIVISLLIAGYLVITGLVDHRTGRDRMIDRGPEVTWGARLAALRDNFWGLPMPFIVIAGIYTGLFTPTESAAVLLLYSLIVGLFILRTLKWTNLTAGLLTGMSTYGMIMLILFGGTLSSQLAAFTGFANELGARITALNVAPIVVIIVMMVILLILGAFMDVFSMFLLTLPIFFPIITALGFDPVWFAILLIINIEIGQVSPPVGVALYIISGLTKVNIGTVIKGSIPYMILLLAGMALVLFIPELATWLPSTMK